jgi:hypothetical protein
MAYGGWRSYGKEQGTRHAGDLIMASEKEGSRTRRKGSTGQDDSGRVGRMVDFDPWGAFFENFWGQTAEGESVDRPDGGRKPAKGTRTTVTKPGRQGRSPRAS